MIVNYIYVTNLMFTCLFLLLRRTTASQRGRTEINPDGAYDKKVAINKLSQVFDLDIEPGKIKPHRSPPDYMRQLYDSIADEGGVSMSRAPYGADIIRGLPNKGVFGT